MFERLFNFIFCIVDVFCNLIVFFICYRNIKSWYFALAKFMHQHKSAVHVITKNGNKFTVYGILKSFPRKLAVFAFRCYLREVITQHIYTLLSPIFLFHKICDEVAHFQFPVSAGAHFITFQIQKFIGRNICRKDISMQFQHHWKNNAMKNDVVFSYKMNQLRIIIIPIWFPIFVVVDGPLLGGGNISNRCIKPNIEHFTMGIFQWHLNSPVEVAGNCA